jgi:hypothetical protein
MYKIRMHHADKLRAANRSAQARKKSLFEKRKEKRMDAGAWDGRRRGESHYWAENL